MRRHLVAALAITACRAAPAGRADASPPPSPVASGVVEVLEPISPTSYPLAHHAPGKAFPPSLLAADDFSFELGQGSGRDGYEAVHVSRAGSYAVTGSASTKWCRAPLSIPKADIDALARELTDSGLLELDGTYVASVDDGTQWYVRLRGGGQSVVVRFDNHFPRAVARVSAWVRASLVAPRRTELARCEPVPVECFDRPAPGEVCALLSPDE